MAIISGVAVAVIIFALAVYVHLKQSAIEVNEQGNETTSQKLQEITNVLTSQNKTNSEASESPQQRASEGK
jgi:hypothetical protein